MIYEALQCLQLLAQVFEGTTLSRPWTNPKANATIDIEDCCDWNYVDILGMTTDTATVSVATGNTPRKIHSIMSASLRF